MAVTHSLCQFCIFNCHMMISLLLATTKSIDKSLFFSCTRELCKFLGSIAYLIATLMVIF